MDHQRPLIANLLIISCCKWFLTGRRVFFYFSKNEVRFVSTPICFVGVSCIMLFVVTMPTVVQHDFHIRWCSCRLSVTRRVSCGAGTANPFGTPEFTPGFQWGSCCSIFSFLCNVLWVVVWPLYVGYCVVYFIDFRLLMALLVSSNISPKKPLVLTLGCIDYTSSHWCWYFHFLHCLSWHNQTWPINR
jgi:hypothetical protein